RVHKRKKRHENQAIYNIPSPPTRVKPFLGFHASPPLSERKEPLDILPDEDQVDAVRLDAPERAPDSGVHRDGTHARIQVKEETQGEVHQPRRIARTAASSVASTVCRGGADIRAVGGSFRPWRGRTQPTRAPAEILPSLQAFMRPATAAAEAGSQKTPSSSATCRYAWRISGYDTVPIAPWDSSI